MKEAPNKWKKQLTIGIIVYATVLMLILMIANRNSVNRWGDGILFILRPTLIGLVLAYLCNPIFRFFERRAFCHIHSSGLRRTVSLTCTYLSVLIAIFLLLVAVLPQLRDSLVMLVENYDYYLSSLIGRINGMLEWANGLINRVMENDTFFEYLDEEEIRQRFADIFGDKGSNLVNYLSQININPIRDVVSDAISVFTDSILGIFVSLYLLATKERRYAQIMKVRKAFLSDGVNSALTNLCRTADRSFGGFLKGKIVDSLLIGLISYLLLIILRIPYAILVAVFLAFFDIIPVIGLIIGAIPSTFVILIAEPSKVIPFLLVVFLLQQLDGNIISPKILGNNTGVSSLCVIIAITTVGTLWGVAGMILGVPIFATILAFSEELIQKRLHARGIPSGVENYYAPNVPVDPVKDVRINTDRTLKRVEKEVLTAQRKQQLGIPLSVMERFHVKMFGFFREKKIIAPISDEIIVQFAAEKAEREIAEELAHRPKNKPEKTDAPSAPEASGTQTEDSPLPGTLTAESEVDANGIEE